MRLSIKLVISLEHKNQSIRKSSCHFDIHFSVQKFVVYSLVVRTGKYCEILHSSGGNSENGTVSTVPNSPIMSNILSSCLLVLTSVSNKFEDSCSKSRL